MNEDVDEEPRDIFGLTTDDWMSYLANVHDHYSGAALLLWGMADVTGESGMNATTGAPLTEMLKALAGDALALATLARGSLSDPVHNLSPALHNLARRLSVAAELVRRAELDDSMPPRPRGPREKAPPAEGEKLPALPAARELARSAKR